MKLTYCIVLTLLLICGNAYAITMPTARGNLEVADGDVLGGNSMWEGTVKGLNNVTFYDWNFSRQTKQEVFINCTNLTFVRCNLRNVIIPKDRDFKIIDCNHFYYREFEQDGQLYAETIHENGDKVTAMVLRETFDVVDREFTDEKGYDDIKRAEIRQQYIDEGLPVERKIDDIIDVSLINKVNIKKAPIEPKENDTYVSGNEVKVYKKGKWITAVKKENANENEKLGIIDARRLHSAYPFRFSE